MINTGNSLFAGRMVLNGLVTSNTDDQATTRLGSPLATGLRIRGLPADSAASGSASLTNASEAESSPAGQKIIENFSDTLRTRLENEQLKLDPADRKSSEEMESLLDSLDATLNKIKTSFGQETANQVMANILTNTETKVLSDRIARAVTSAMQGLANKTEATLNDPEADSAAQAQAQAVDDKLKDFLEFLNKETQEAGETKGLSQALGEYFDNPIYRTEGYEGSRKIFDENFAFRTVREIENDKLDETDGRPNLTLSVAEFGRDHMEELAKFLRDEIGHEEAASYIENLADSDDILSAVNQVRQMLYENTEPVEHRTEVTAGVEVSGWRREGQGIEDLQKFNEYFNFNMLDAINETFRNDPVLLDRLKNYTAQTTGGSADDLPDSIGFTGFSVSLSYNANDHTYGNSYGRALVADLGGTTAEERYEQFLQGAGLFWKEQAATAVNDDDREKYELAAQNSDRRAEEYLLAKGKTLPGALIDQEI